MEWKTKEMKYNKEIKEIKRVTLNQDKEGALDEDWIIQLVQEENMAMKECGSHPFTYFSNVNFEIEEL